jgi:ElaA protein
MNWQTKSFEELNVNELYEILTLRSEVFVVEQNCVFLDMDHRDQACLHLLGWENDSLVAYCRLVPPGVSYPEPSIGRVVTSPRHRSKGAGRVLMNKAISIIRETFGDQPVRIGAQHYLKGFYSSLGFEPHGDIYMEDGILHIEMILP